LQAFKPAQSYQSRISGTGSDQVDNAG